jgi:hypothetical protein
MVHVIMLALGVFMSSLRVNGRTKSCEAHEHNWQFGEHERTDIGKSQRLRPEGNTTINKVLAMRPRLATIIENIHIASHFERPETNIPITPTPCCIDYTDTWSSKHVQ